MNVLISLLPDFRSTMLFFVLSDRGLCICFDFFYTFTFIYFRLVIFWRFLIRLGQEQNSVVLPMAYINVFTLGYRNVKLLTASGTKLPNLSSPDDSLSLQAIHRLLKMVGVFLAVDLWAALFNLMCCVSFDNFGG